MQVLMLRHGKTQHNLDSRYTGATDVPLCALGEQLLREAAPLPQPECVYVSPMLRARQTAAILFPAARQVVIEELREMNFGDFEGRTAAEMADDPAYIAWLNSDGMAPCPHGDSIDSFAARVVPAFTALIDEQLAAGAERLTIVAHGGVLMAIMSRLAEPERHYFDWSVKNGQGYLLRVEREVWLKERRVSAWQPA
ncbi:MAG: histidine phosphatase family protein [Bacillota bacterium]|nr:histidine phosphatase family protein [Bacillota bacterium]